jgi:hypothetical protein
VGIGEGKPQCWTCRQSIGYYLGGGADHPLCGLAFNSSFALMVKATRRKASQPAVWAGVQPKKSQALPAPYEENRSSLER